MDTDLQAIVNGIKDVNSSLKNAVWWELVQEEVKERLEIILDNLIVLGPLFKDTFVASFKYEHARRMIEGHSIKSDMPGAFGSAMTEEAYQCGIEPTRLVLHLQDWVKPNDADVQICMDLCHKLEEMEAKGLLGPAEIHEPKLEREKKWRERLKHLMVKNNEVPRKQTDGE